MSQTEKKNLYWVFIKKTNIKGEFFRNLKGKLYFLRGIKMRRYMLVFVFLLVSYLSFETARAADECECPELQCGSCQVQKSLKFYSEKCGDGQVNSCAKPVCIDLDPLPQRCVASVNKNKKVKNNGPKVEDMNFQNIQIEIGYAKSVKKGAWVQGLKGKKKSLTEGMKVYESDTLSTDSKGQLVVNFHDKNEMILQKDSKIKLIEYKNPKKNKKMGSKALLDLLKGKVRNKVKTKYKRKASFYKIRTKSAVAGVRGTDFVVSFSQDKNETTKIETLTGEVVLSDAKENTNLHIKAGNYASYVVASNEMFNESEIKDFVAKGYMTPVYKISKKEVDKIHWDTRFVRNKARNVASKKSKSKNICSSPSAKLNQCAWHCDGNPKQASSCRSDLPQVKCVRQRCNANGNWAEEIRLPASSSELCPSKGYKVDHCNY